ncbi:hypothetical protein BUE80_DR006545 [Diplocarpon rosae]|nr:hypothetical protein BUE80_DR006545 [Diplocarpon rosae]
MDKRFSTLILESSSLSKDVSPDAKPSSKIKRVLGRLFAACPPSIAKSPEPSPVGERRRSDDVWTSFINLSRNPSRRMKQSILLTKKKALATPFPNQEPPSQATDSITIHVPSDYLPTYTSRDIFYKGKGKPVVSSRDSKFSFISSISSRPSLESLAATSSPPSPATTVASGQVALNPLDFTQLQTLLRRASRRLQQQEHLVSNLAKNLLHFLARKEMQVRSQKRMRKAEQQNMLQTLSKVQETCHQLFSRKSAFLQHMIATLAKVRKMMDESSREAVLSIPEACTSKRAAEGVIYVVKRERVMDLVVEAASDGDLQRNLDKQVAKCVLDRAREARWVGSVSDRIMMARFQRFLEARGRALGGCYASLEALAKDIEGLVKENERIFV